ncbi:hypothetical protein T484DRAFT_1589403, partial [Baffinella frigidus]
YTCACNAGYAGDGFGCSSCGADKYTEETGTKCSTCPNHTTSEAGSDELTDCRCVAGYTAPEDGDACSACEVGTYKTSTGTGACSGCPDNTESVEGSSDLASCVCSAGFTGNDGGPCNACVVGEFKATVGSGSCAACPLHTSSVGGSTELIDCKCVAGYTAASDGVACRVCDTGTYTAATGAGECSTCPAGTSSASGSVKLADCKCLAGYLGTLDGVACTACVAGMFKRAVGTADCQFCPANSESASGSALCYCSA